MLGSLLKELTVVLQNVCGSNSAKRTDVNYCVNRPAFINEGTTYKYEIVKSNEMITMGRII